MEQQELTIEWLTRKVMGLLTHASGSAGTEGEGRIDHQACSRYAEILFKVLPKKHEAAAASGELTAEVRKMLEQDKTRPG